MSTFWFVVACLVLYLLVSRVCDCLEYCSMARAVGKLRESGMIVKPEDIDRCIRGKGNEGNDICG